MYKQTFTLCTQASLICVSAFIHVYVCPLIKPLLIYLSPLYSFQTFTHLSVYLSSLHSSFCPRLHSSVYSPSFLYISIHPTFTHFSIHPVFTHLYIQSAFILCLFDIHSPVCLPSLNSLRSVTQMMYEIQMSALPLETVVFGRDNFQCFLLVQAIFMTDDQVFPG